LQQGRYQELQVLQLGALGQVAKRLTPTGAHAHLVQHLVELAAQLPVPLLHDLVHGAIKRQTCRHGDGHQVERIG
jgi:hypothetical protein